MRTSVEMEVRCTFLEHSKVLRDPWEYDEKQASSTMGNTHFASRESEALSEA